MVFLLNGKPVDALALIVHRSAEQEVGRAWVKKLREFPAAINQTLPDNMCPCRQGNSTAAFRGAHTSGDRKEDYSSRDTLRYASRRHSRAVWGHVLSRTI